jgi:putative ABC transport system permease protein
MSRFKLHLHFAWREIRNNSRFSFFFILNLALGLSGFLTIQAFKDSIEASLASRSRELLTADIRISARRALSDLELSAARETLGPNAEMTQALEMYSMVASTTTSRLAEIAVISEPYPFYGALRLRQGGAVGGQDPKQILKGPFVWIQSDLAAQLRAPIGSQLRIGAKEFTVADWVDQDNASGSRGFSLASRVYIGDTQLAGADLIRKGSTIAYKYLYRLPVGSDANTLASALNRRFSEPGIRVVSHERGSEMVGRLQGFLNDYLGLAALASLFLSALGAAYLFRSFLARRLRELAILISLGLKPVEARRLYLIQLAILGAMASVASALIVAALLPWTMKALGRLIAYPIEPVMSLLNLVWAFGIGIVGSLLTCWPILTRLRDLNPSALFQEASSMSLPTFTRTSVLTFLPALLLYWGLAVWQSQSWRTGSAFAGLFLGSGVVLGLAASLLMSFLSRLSGHSGLWIRLAARQMARSRLASVSAFLAIGLGVLLINVIPQIQASLSEEVRAPGVSEVPSLFLFDIQPEQESAVRKFLEEKGAGLNFLTPLIRGRLEAVNGQTFQKELEPGAMTSREEENSSRMRNRAFNLTYRGELTESERLIAGRPFSATVGEMAELSVEQRFAKRLNLKIGDVMRFDVQGVPVEGKIVNLRSVKWTSFQPNFFVQFQPGVLEDAPKTFLASVPSLPPAGRLALQDALVAKFPTVSIIDVSQVVERLLAIFGQMAWAIRWMAFLSLAAGFLVLFSIASHEAHTRQSEANLLKVLGAKLSGIRLQFRLEYGTLAISAGLLSTLLSFGVSYALSQLLFDNTWIFAWKMPLAVVAGTAVLAVVIIDLAAARTLRQSPIGLLQGES